MIRLFVADVLDAGGRVAVTPEQGHYLTRVMRLAPGDDVLAFNGRDGEWRARLAPEGKRGFALEVGARVRPQAFGPDLDLLIAVVKRARLETIVEKAAELGVRRIRPILTERVSAPPANVARLLSIAIEAAEQCGRLDVPEVATPVRLDTLFAAWPEERRLMFCDEGGEAATAMEALRGLPAGPWSVLIGPEGGFSPGERAAIRARDEVTAVSLGPRILRADTAAISALTLWQSALGDWRGA